MQIPDFPLFPQHVIINPLNLFKSNIQNFKWCFSIVLIINEIVYFFLCLNFFKAVLLWLPVVVFCLFCYWVIYLFFLLICNSSMYIKRISLLQFFLANSYFDFFNDVFCHPEVFFNFLKHILSQPFVHI